VPIRIALTEDSSIVRRRAAVAHCQPEVEIVAAVADQALLRQACDEAHSDVVLSDIGMPAHPHRRGGGTAAEIDKAKPARQRRDHAGPFDAIKAKALA
jgi:DNA-binding NarL/FixJ family response regulator